MNKRCIVNFADGEFYAKLQGRLMYSFAPCTDSTFINCSKVWSRDPLHNFEAKGSLSEFKGIDLLLWRHEMPNGARPHNESPYGFKVHCIKAAYDLGYTSILWVDAPAYAVKEDISPIFEKIEKEGYYAMSHIDPLENWVGNEAISSFGFDRDILKGHNLPSGSCYGFRIDKPMPTNWPLEETELFWDLYFQEADGMFASEVFGEGKWHRHDEAILALNLIKRGLPIFLYDELFQNPSPNCVIRSGELLDLTPNI